MDFEATLTHLIMLYVFDENVQSYYLAQNIL